MNKKILFSFCAFVFCSHSVHADIKSFVKQGFHRCSNKCESENIQCKKGVNTPGFYDWCKQNCQNEKKSNAPIFQDGIDSCDRQSAPSRLPTPETNLGALKIKKIQSDFNEFCLNPAEGLQKNLKGLPLEKSKEIKTMIQKYLNDTNIALDDAIFLEGIGDHVAVQKRFSDCKKNLAILTRNIAGIQ